MNIAQQTTLSFSEPVYLKDHFKIPVDNSVWNGTYHDYISGNKSPQKYFTPDRARADFGSLTNALIARPDSDCASNIPLYGIYILAFDFPKPAIYVGIAAETGTETILSRIKKHRVKITGSNIGVKKNSNGGVSHTKGWRDFAAQRYAHITNEGGIDSCEDVRLITGVFNASRGKEFHKKEAEYFERFIERDNNILNSIIKRLWPDRKYLTVSNLYMITSRTSKGLRPQNPEILLWDGTRISTPEY